MWSLRTDENDFSSNSSDQAKIKKKKTKRERYLSESYRCSVLKMANMCLLDMKLFSTSLTFRLSKGSMYFFSFSCGISRSV